MDDIVPKSIPKFEWQRRKLYDDNVPPINLKIGYLNKETNDVTVVQGEKTPVSKFSPMQYTKLYEVATVKVIIYDVTYVCMCRASSFF